MNIGDRVALHPATDWWMRGARFGRIKKIGRKLVHVQLEVAGIVISKVVRFKRDSDLIEVVR